MVCFLWNRISSPHKKAAASNQVMWLSAWTQGNYVPLRLRTRILITDFPSSAARPLWAANQPEGLIDVWINPCWPWLPWSTWSKLVERAIMLELRIRQQLSQRRRRRWSSSFERAIMLEHQIRRPGYHKPMALAIDQQHEKSELLNCRSRMPLIDVCTEEHQPSKKLLVSESGGFLAF